MTEKKQWSIDGWIKQPAVFYVEAESAREAEEKVGYGHWDEYEPTGVEDWELTGDAKVVVE